MFGWSKKVEMVRSENALPGRDDVMPVPPTHFVNGHPLKDPFPDGLDKAMFGLGCFWGVRWRSWAVLGRKMAQTRAGGRSWAGGR